jgi:hypothetical protein
MQNTDLHNKLDTVNAELPNTSPQTAKKGLRRSAFLAGGLSVSAAVTYFIARALRRSGVDVADNFVDDRGTGQKKAARILRNLRDRAFEASDEKLALALGRPVSEVAAWNAGSEIIDDDVVMKARGIAMHRGVHVE